MPVRQLFLMTQQAHVTTRFVPRRLLKLRGGLAGLVAIARGKTPDPIPNSAVKTLSADGTAS